MPGVKHPWITCKRNKSSASMTDVACKSKLRLVVRSFMHPCPGNWVAIGCAGVYYARASHAFSAGIKCQHCSDASLPAAVSETGSSQWKCLLRQHSHQAGQASMT